MFYDTSHSLTVPTTVLAEWGSSYHRLLSSEASVNTSCVCLVEVKPVSFWHLLFPSLNLKLILRQKFLSSCCQMKLFSVSPNTVPHLNTIILIQPKEVTIVHCLLLSRCFLGLVCVYLCATDKRR